MESIKNITESTDFSKIENILRDKLIELQIKTHSLEHTQRELVQARQSLYEKDRSIEEGRQEAALLRSQLDIATGVIRRWEEEKTVNRCHQVQTAMHSNTIIRERDCLLNQTKNLQLENMILKQKLNELGTINENRKPNDEILNNIRNDTSLIIKSADSQISKLHGELERLERAVKSANKLNGRLQAAGMCSYAIQRKYEMKIQELEGKLNSTNPFE